MIISRPLFTPTDAGQARQRGVVSTRLKPPVSFISSGQRVISSAGERSVHTGEVTGSIPVLPTRQPRGPVPSPGTGPLGFPGTPLWTGHSSDVTVYILRHDALTTALMGCLIGCLRSEERRVG